MNFNVGDMVVHWTFGLGRITGLEERTTADHKARFFLVQIRELTVYVPDDENTPSRLRFPTPAGEFHRLFAILRGAGEPLAENRMERKSLLHKSLADGTAETICRVIRDLTALSRSKALNDDDKSILLRAQSLLTAEWVNAFSVPKSQAEAELHQLLLEPSSPAAG